MKKCFLTMLAALSLSTAAVNAEVWTGMTSPAPDDAVYLYNAPGIYSELSGNFAIGIDSYTQISNSVRLNNGVFNNEVQAVVVNADNDVVYSGNYTFAGPAYSRNYTGFMLNIPEEDAITTPGTYYIIFPIAVSETEPTGAYVGPQKVADLYDLKIGPFIVADAKSPVPAEFTVTPTGDYPGLNLPNSVTFSLPEDAVFFNVNELESLKVYYPDGKSIEMGAATKKGNTLTWQFESAFQDMTSKPAGEYKMVFNLSSYSAYTSDYAPYQFPASATYTFTITDGKAKVTPQFTLANPETSYTDWATEAKYPNLIGVTLSDYKFATRPAAKSISLLIITPSGETKEILLQSGTETALQFLLTTWTDPFTEVGTYKCYVKLDGIEGVSATDESLEVIFNDISFEYTINGIPDPEDAIVELTPDGNYLPYAAPTDVELLVSNATSITIEEGSSLLTVTKLDTRAGEVVATVAPVISGNKISWALPTDLAEGNYESSVSFEGISAKTAEGADIIFPTEPLVQQFSVTTPEYPEADLTATVVPAAGQYKEWTADQINVDFTNYRLEDTKVELPAFKARPAVLTLPDGSTTDLYLKASGGSNVKKGYYVVPAGTFSQNGKYTLTVPVGGLVAYPQTASAATDENRVVLNNYVIEYTVGDTTTGVDAIGVDEAGAVYYDMNGIKLDSKPAAGMYIKVVNGQGSIVLVK